MDPVVAIVGLIDGSSRIINTLFTLRDKFRDADLLLRGLAVQLTTLRAALGEINEWMKYNAEQRCQLALELGESLTFCRLLVDKLNKDLMELSNGSPLQPDTLARLRTCFSTGSIGDIQVLLDRQTNAINLLLATYNCRSLTPRKARSDDTGRRDQLTATLDDTSSLYPNRDRSSVISYCTETFSRISKEFTFDRSLMCTKVYSNSSLKLIDLLRRRIREESATAGPNVEKRRPSLKSDPFDSSKAMDLLVVNGNGRDSQELMQTLGRSKNLITPKEEQMETAVAVSGDVLSTINDTVNRCLHIRSKKLDVRFTDVQTRWASGDKQWLHNYVSNAFGVVYIMEAPCCPHDLQLRELYNEAIERATSPMNASGLKGRPVFICLVGDLGEFDEKQNVFCKLLRKYVEESSLRHKLYIQYIRRPFGSEVEQYVVGKCIDHVIQREIRSRLL